MSSRQARPTAADTETDAVHSENRAVYALLPGQLTLHRTLQEMPEAMTSLWMSYRVDGPLDVSAFVDAVRSTVARHAGLRIGVTTQDGAPVQWVRPIPDQHPIVTLTRVTANDTEQFTRYVRAVLATDLRHTFDLAVDYPFIIRLLRFSPTLHAAIGVFSALAVDATARMAVVREIWDTYFGRPPGAEPKDADYLAAVTSRTAAGTTGRSRAVSAYWRRRAPWLPPRCQFLPGIGGPATPTARTELLPVVGPEWEVLRRRWQESGFTTAQWLLAVFAATVFLVTPQDRIAISMRLNGRRHPERGIVGMFDVTVPVVLDRPARPADLLVQVRREQLTATSRRDVSPQVLDEMWAATARRLGHPVHRTLLMTYLEDTADLDLSGRAPVTAGLDPSGRAPVTIERGAYTPAFQRIADGLRIAVNERPDGLRIRLTVDGGSMSQDSFTRFVTAFRARLNGDDHSGRVAAAPPGAPTLASLRAPDGAVLLVVDLAEVTAALERHPEVTSATAAVEIADDGGSRVAAEVTTGDVPVTADELADRVRATLAHRPYLAVPGRISVGYDSASGDRPEALLRDGVG
ncbi:condensation domain-containing protein [Verrucosispora sp. WMMD573]|uniref:condensation domain-containing protein n=1 Tax=Verrucosispora sp. WMMD573 TaxID=3015149 RepID=UPI00248BEEA5|nr:condensation domain-containing protein [Verrucosispora sp. WMMD573]WBB53249.1 condensation domain-containing protein [Verrucosispora sp. WMMD573]